MLMKSLFAFAFLALCDARRVEVQLHDRTKQQVSKQDNDTTGIYAHMGLEVEFADGRVARKLMSKGKLAEQNKKHECSRYLEYGVPWFSSAEATTDLSADWGIELPLMEIESEVYDRNTMEVVTGPLGAGGTVQSASAIVMLAKQLKGTQSSMTQFQALASGATGLTLTPQIDADCSEQVYMKLSKDQLTAGVQVNFEMKLSKMMKLMEQETWAYFGGNGVQFWTQAATCFHAYMSTFDSPPGTITDAQKGAYLVAFHQAAVAADCERDQKDSSCKKGRVLLLPKVALDTESTMFREGSRALNALTGKTWHELKAEMNEIKPSTACMVPQKWRPDNHMFSKPIPGVGGSEADPYIVLEHRTSSGGIAWAVKQFLSYYEKKPPSVTPATDRSAGAVLKARAQALQQWAFGAKTSSELLASLA